MTWRPCRSFANRQKQTLFVCLPGLGTCRDGGLRTAKHNPEDFRAAEPLMAVLDLLQWKNLG